MKVNKDKMLAAYTAISDPIMDLRISAKMRGREIDSLELDEELFKLQIEIWERLRVALNITN